jgi:geranylgeranyl reductase family protein
MTKMKHYPVIIVGAGPAGAMAGFYLAKAGIDVLVLEKSPFPRRKVCGGGLTQRAWDEIPFDISEVIHASVDWGYIASRGRTRFSIHNDRPISYLVDRLTFDSKLVDQAVLMGATCQTSERVRSIKEGNPVTLQTNKSTYSCNYLVGADGVHSLVAKAAGLIPNRKTSLAYEARLALPTHPEEQQADSVTFDFGTIIWGYGWIFPKRDHLNVGVCRSWPLHQAKKRHLMRFISQHSALHKSPIIDIRAYPVPLGGKTYQLHKDNILLVGDAANLADPWLGEGLFYALASGRMAAEAITNQFQGSSTDLSSYSYQVNSTLVREFLFARRFSLLVNALPYLNTTILKASHTLQNLIIDLLRGEKSYEQTWREIKTLIPRAFQKMFQRK